MRFLWKASALAAAGVAVAVGGGTLAMAAEDTATPASLVEDFSYPGRDKILADHGLKLISGDGNILFVDCNVAGDVIKVESYDFADYVCFQVRGDHGYLSLEIKRATYIFSENQPLEAELKYDGVEQTATKQVPENYWTTIGEAENLPSATVLEIRA
ncbi:hypothetical protein Aph02nite_57080 [Actinoplanes philippinensis]|uniref:Secreted protein n=1 Tax=Actinoplanes philippinensis TaxID=35752 RepID=A0A1I2J134_9ACTN|nr:hypothetical protein [Actinoplanes philippinensis]GIE79758.1 hypothetical protein Aph02nite_57080 [Actinoplanes philippinensis]SFF47728.1 hypothetical protein SAMN05421541_11193 [Actinoplanes philippinensis]